MMVRSPVYGIAYYPLCAIKNNGLVSIDLEMNKEPFKLDSLFYMVNAWNGNISSWKSREYFSVTDLTWVNE